MSSHERQLGATQNRVRFEARAFEEGVGFGITHFVAVLIETDCESEHDRIDIDLKSGTLRMHAEPNAGQIEAGWPSVPLPRVL